jgi:Xaa-Pro aminopeptidase
MTEPTPHERRTRDCQRRLRELGADAVVLFPSRNLQYLAGFTEEPKERHFFLFVPADGEPVFLAPELSAEQVREESWVPDVRGWADEDDPLAAVESIAADVGLGGGRLLVDDTMWATFTQDLRAVLPDAEFGLASDVLAELRVRKDEAELDAIDRAADVADAILEDLRDLGDDAVGMTENELARYIERRAAEYGAQGLSFEPTVGSGPNGAKPHHSHGERAVQAGEPVVFDFGVRVDDYPSDQTRTLVFGGDPPEKVTEIHEIVQRAQRAAVEAVGPGVPAEDVDAAAREVIADAGYGEYFVHRTGHGLGLDVHEEPYIVAGNDRELEPGMVHSVEPGIYLPGEFGVRVEDIVVVTDDGVERLNHTDRGW